MRINTNGTLLNDHNLDRLREYCVNLMVSMHEFSAKDYAEINRVGAEKIYGINQVNNFEDKYFEKIKQLKKIQNYRNLTLDFLTILTPKNIIYLEKLYEFVLGNFSLANWHFFRLYSTGTTQGISRAMIALAIRRIDALNEKYRVRFKIVDSVPFCVIKDLEMESRVVDGELSDDHNVKTIITSQ